MHRPLTWGSTAVAALIVLVVLDNGCLVFPLYWASQVVSPADSALPRPSIPAVPPCISSQTSPREPERTECGLQA